MGNCQVATMEMAEIQHLDRKIERIYWPIRACHVMATNPGHYVAIVVTHNKMENNTRKKAVKYLKLLFPDDTLLLGNSYHLVTFEEVLREFKLKKHVRLSRLLRKRENCSTSPNLQMEEEEEDKGKEVWSNSDFASRNGELRNKQWKPALERIEEDGPSF